MQVGCSLINSMSTYTFFHYLLIVELCMYPLKAFFSWLSPFSQEYKSTLLKDDIFILFYV
jgi:hypothetical protein